MKVYIYPGDSVVGGSIEEREVSKVLDHKVIYAEPDKWGYIGCKRSSVFFTREQAELAKNNDRMSDHPRFTLVENSFLNDRDRSMAYLIQGPRGDALRDIAGEHKRFWNTFAEVVEIKFFNNGIMVFADFQRKGLTAEARAQAPEILGL